MLSYPDILSMHGLLLDPCLGAIQPWHTILTVDYPTRVCLARPEYHAYVICHHIAI